MPTTSARSSAIATSSSAKTPVHFTESAASGLPVSGSNAARAVQAVGRVLLGRPVAEALAGHHVHDHRAAERLGPAQRLLDRVEVVPVDRSDVLEPEVLEHRLRGDRVLEALLHRVQDLVERRADQRRAPERVLDHVEDLLVARVEAQRGQVVGQAADGRRVGPAVVVDDDDQRVLGRGDVVQRLPAHAAGERAVADHGHHVPLLAAQGVGLGQAVGVGQRGRGVRVLDDVVLALGLVRVAGEPTAAAQQVEAVLPAGHDLVHVGLVAGVEQDPVLGRVEDPVQRQRELDHTEVGAEVPAGAGHLGDQEVPDLGGEHVQLLAREAPEVRGATDRVDQRTVSSRRLERHS